MSLLEIIQLIGYSTGAALPLWLSALLARQRRELNAQERVLLALAVSIGLWHASNLLLTLRALLGLDVGRWVGLLRLTDSIAVTSITFAYSFLLHVHLHLWATARRRPLTRFERVRIYLSYVPTVFLFVVVPRLWTGAYAPMLTKLSFFVLPFGLWATYVLCLIAITDLLIARHAQSTGERRLMTTLAGSFLLIAVLLLSVYALGFGREPALRDYLLTLGNLGSLLPTALIAYHVYRYRYLELIIRESLVAATFAVLILVLYLYGIRTFETWLTARYQLRTGVVEALLILAFALLAAPLRAWLERRFQPLFAREAALYREVVTRLGTQAHRYQQLPELLRFVAAKTEHELSLRRVRFHLLNHNAPASDNARRDAPAFLQQRAVVRRDGALAVASFELAADGRGHGIDAVPDEDMHNDDYKDDVHKNDTHVITTLADAHVDELARQAWAEQLLQTTAAPQGVIEGTPELRTHGFELAYPLRREERAVGLMLIDAVPAALTAEVRAVLSVLAGQLAIAVEDARLVEENVLLERRLAHGERLAALGQMAATVAHEVKNPLSAIKSIAQVMREDERLTVEYARDLELIVGETDRLSRSVTQLLSFARQQPPAGAPTRATELARALVELCQPEARARAIKLELQATTAAMLTGAQAAAVRDALSNLILNALQATPKGGRVSVEIKERADGLLFAVTDSGPGVARELRPRIWEPFFTTRQRGTGLGLAIVRKRMTEVGAQARLAPQLSGPGARFELLLPRATVAADLQT
jgi:signal transduction histidine kinase